MTSTGPLPPWQVASHSEGAHAVMAKDEEGRGRVRVTRNDVPLQLLPVLVHESTSPVSWTFLAGPGSQLIRL